MLGIACAKYNGNAAQNIVPKTITLFLDPLNRYNTAAYSGIYNNKLCNAWIRIPGISSKYLYTPLIKFLDPITRLKNMNALNDIMICLQYLPIKQ